MPSRTRIRQYSNTSLLRRIRFQLTRLGGTRLQKSQRGSIVEINGTRFKRLIQPDSRTAESIETTLNRLGETNRVPGVVIRYERELWVDFIKGTAIASVDAGVARKMADLFAELHSRDPRLVRSTETRFPTRLRRNLRFFEQVGVLSQRQHDALLEVSQRVQPEALWVGFDYTDSVLKNFISAEDDGRVCAIDVESIAADELIGISFAKASERWLGPWRDEYLEHLNRPGVPDFRPYLPFVELYFLGHWMQRAFFEKKWRFVNAELFDRFLDASPNARALPR